MEGTTPHGSLIAVALEVVKTCVRQQYLFA